MKFYKKNKKAAIEVQFGWIFVLVVGALILLFFVSVVKSTGKASEETKYADLKNYLKSMLSQSEVDVGTTRTIGMPNIELEFECNRFNIKESSTDSITTSQKTIFSPDLISGREMITYSQYFDMPYKVDYFLYITSKQARYNFINCTTQPCSGILSSIIKTLPANITYQIVNNAGDVKENNYYKERFIFIWREPTSSDTISSLSTMNNNDVTAVSILNNNQIKYYKKNGNKFSTTPSLTSAYMGPPAGPMAIGAIFSESSLYECNVRKSLLKLEIISTIYANRTQALKEYYSSYAISTHEYEICYKAYNTFDLSQNIAGIKSVIEDETPLSSSLFLTITFNADKLKEANENTLMLASCPLIY